MYFEILNWANFHETNSDSHYHRVYNMTCPTFINLMSRFYTCQRYSINCPYLVSIFLYRNGLGCDILSQINEITDGLYLCGARAMRAQHLLELGITNVVNVTVELPCLNIDEVCTLTFCSVYL